MKDKEVFILYASCIPVKGFKRSIICDLQRQQYYFIPNDLFDILNNEDYVDFEKIQEEYRDDLETINEYFNFLLTQELGHWTREPELFTNISLNFETPESITNAIVDINSRSNHNYISIASQLDHLGCKALQLRFFEAVKISEIENILSYFNKTRLRHLDIVMKYQSQYTKPKIKKICQNFGRVNSIVLYSSDVNEHYKIDNLESHIYLQIKEISSCFNCGLVSNNYFMPNLKHFIEAKNYNSCLNKKISIDIHGNIKNCPSMRNSFGNLSDASLNDTLKDSHFKDSWRITKDMVTTCQSCEFRYICTDCRAYIEEPDNILSKPLKCGYDPYTAKWEDWRKHPKKQNSIKYYEINEFGF